MEGSHETAFLAVSRGPIVQTRSARCVCDLFFGTKVAPVIARMRRRNATSPSACAESTSTVKPVNSNTQCSDSREIIELFWEHTNRGRFLSVLDLFTEDAVYHDMLYPSAFKGKTEIERHLRNMEDVLPADKLNFVLDDIAPGFDKVGTRWHVETKTGSRVPFSRGASMYSLVRTENNGILISEVWDFPETPIKAAGILLPLLKIVSVVFR